MARVAKGGSATMRAATRVNAICATAHIAFYGLFPVMRCTRPIPLWSQGQAAFAQRITVADRVAIVRVSFGKEIRQCSDSTICSSEPTRFSGILLLHWPDPASPTSLTVPSRAPGRPRCAGSPLSKSRSSTTWSLVSKERWLGLTLKPPHGDGSPRTLHAGVGTPMLPNATLSHMPPAGYASRAAWRTRQYRPIRTLA